MTAQNGENATDAPLSITEEGALAKQLAEIREILNERGLYASQRVAKIRRVINPTHHPVIGVPDI